MNIVKVSYDLPHPSRLVCERVSSARSAHGVGVGKPTEKEAREALVEVKGDVGEAATKIFNDRETKVSIVKCCEP